jgi:hypothetical protein
MRLCSSYKSVILKIPYDAGEVLIHPNIFFFEKSKKKDDFT